MIRREGKKPPSSDLLVCFPTRSHLALMPKPLSSPRRHHHHHHHNHHLRKSMRGGSTGGGHASPYDHHLKAQISSENLSEPTSPKVTCAGQIKVRPRSACKNWQTVMEEIERIHINRIRKKKKPNWVEALGFKKEVMHFLACLRRIKFDFRCLGTFSHVDVITSDDEEDEEGVSNDKDIDQIQIQDQDQDQENNDYDDDEEVSTRTVFSKWFMVLQENNQDCGVFTKEEKSLKLDQENDQDPPPQCLPPANALLLMRCRSAPAKSWMEEKQEEEKQQEEKDDDDDNDNDDDDDDGGGDDDDEKMGIKKENKRKSLMELMKNDEGDFYKLTSDIGKERWVIGGIQKDPFSRSRSWRR